MTEFIYLFGVAGVVQAALLPGLALLFLLRIRANLFLMFGLSVAASLPLNYAIVTVLTALGMCTAPVLLVIFVVECIVTLYCWRHKVNCIDLKEDNHGKFQEHNSSLGMWILEWVAFCYAVSALWFFGKRWWLNLGSIFTEWDPALIWNFRAVAWAQNSFPGFYYNYPDAGPIAYSMPYVFMGSSDIQYFSKSIAPVFPFAILSIFFGLWIACGRSGYAIAAAATGFLLNRILAGHLDAGYADTPVALVATASVVLLLLASVSRNEEGNRRCLVLAVLGAAATAHTKQVGLAIAFTFPLLVLGVQLDRGCRLSVAAKNAAISAGIILAAVVPWYYAAARSMSAGGHSLLEYLKYLATGAHANSDLYAKVAGMTSYIVSAIGPGYAALILVSVAACWVIDRFWGRVIIGAILPFWLCWLLLFSYDARNMALALPFFGVAVGVLFDGGMRWALLIGPNWSNSKFVRPIDMFDYFISMLEGVQKSVAVAVSAGVLVSFVYWKVREIELIAKHRSQQMLVGEELVNAAIYEAFSRSPGKILSNYAILNQRLLPGLENAVVPCACLSRLDIRKAMQSYELKYVLLRLDTMPDDEVREHLGMLQGSGALILRFEKTRGRNFRLFEVAAPSP